MDVPTFQYPKSKTNGPPIALTFKYPVQKIIFIDTKIDNGMHRVLKEHNIKH